MKNQNHVYSLIPFHAGPNTNLFSVTAELFQESNSKLILDFEISGDLELITWPNLQKGSPRLENLWQHTCLETFFTTSELENGPYVEINCAPSGAWNAYDFSSYRQGMQNSPNITARLEKYAMDATTARFQIEIESKVSIPLFAFNLSAVIEFSDGSISYWAIRHPSEKPDFHRRSEWTQV